MFVSFLTPHETRGLRARHLAVFYKQLGAFGRDEIAFVGTPEYFRTPDALRAEGRGEFELSWQAQYDYVPPTSLDGVSYRTLPADLFDRRLARLRSPLKLYRAMLTERLPELESAFASALDELSAGRRVEGILAFANTPSVQHVARTRGIPMIHNEIGPLRRPAYVATAYWDRCGVNGCTEAARRFRRFRREIASAGANAGVSILGRDELLCTVRGGIHAANSPAPRDARYRVGVALQVEDDSNLLAYANGFSGLDLIMLAQHRFARDQVAVRPHPQALSRDLGLLGTLDDSADAIEFIHRCETILTINSSTALEALLHGRRCVVFGDSPFRIAADRSLSAARQRRTADVTLALNFLVFGYLVPFELMFDPEYCRWRLGDPSEIEIYRIHQRWYQDRRTELFADDALAVPVRVPAVLVGPAAIGQRHGPLILFGTGHATTALIDAIRGGPFELRGIFDNDERKWKTSHAGLRVDRPSYHADATVLVASLTYGAAMAAQLRALGYPAQRILQVLPAAAGDLRDDRLLRTVS